MTKDDHQEKKGLRVSEERLQQYLNGRYGQRPETYARYADAIQACRSIEYIDKSVYEIAKMFGHREERLRNQLNRHYPEILTERNRLRALLGLNKRPLQGIGNSTLVKYAPAVEMLRSTDLTIREVAERCHVNAASLQEHVLFHHKDVAQKRLKKRLDSLDQRNTGGMSGTGRPNRPRKATEELYAEALEMYRTTTLTVPEIALRCGVICHNFQCYLQRWCRSDIAVREKLRKEKVEKQRKKREKMAKNSRTAVAVRKYSPALQMIKDGATYEEAAERLGIRVDYLCRWVRENHPRIHKKERENQTVLLPEGTTCTKESWAMFKEAAEAYCQTDEPLRQIASRLGLPHTSLRNFLVRKFPQAVAARKAKASPTSS